MDVVVLGGHVIVGLSKKWIAPPGLTTWSRIEIVVGGHVHVCMQSFAGHEKNCFLVAEVAVVVVVAVVL